MTLAPFFAAPAIIKTHILAALAVVLLTPAQFWGFRKGSPPHRVTGYIWLAAMVTVAISSFWISGSPLTPRLGPFSLIHLLSVWALISVFLAIRFARNGNLVGHRKTLIGLSVGFFIAGVFTLAPGRVLGRIFFG